MIGCRDVYFFTRRRIEWIGYRTSHFSSPDVPRSVNYITSVDRIYRRDASEDCRSRPRTRCRPSAPQPRVILSRCLTYRCYLPTLAQWRADIPIDSVRPSVRPSLCQCLFAHRRGIILSPNVEVSGWATAPCVSMSVSLSTKRLSTRWIENSWREVRSVTKFGRQNEVVLTLNPKRYGLRCFDYLASLVLFFTTQVCFTFVELCQRNGWTRSRT